MTAFKRWTKPALLVAGGVMLASATVAIAAKHAAPENDAIRESQAAKLSLSDAVARSQTQFGGKAVKAELEGDEGPLAYEIELVNGQDVREVRLDAVTGAVLSNKADDSDEGEDEHQGAAKGLAD